MHVLLGSERSDCMIFCTFCLASSGAQGLVHDWSAPLLHGGIRLFLQGIQPLVEFLQMRGDFFLDGVGLSGLDAELGS